MKDYELTVLFPPDSDDFESAVDMVRRIITDYGGEIIKEENDGKKRLAYRIYGQDFAIYYFFDLRLPAHAPAKISSALNIEELVLRYLLIRVDNRNEKKHISEKESIKNKHS